LSRRASGLQIEGIPTVREPWSQNYASSIRPLSYAAITSTETNNITTSHPVGTFPQASRLHHVCAAHTLPLTYEDPMLTPPSFHSIAPHSTPTRPHGHPKHLPKVLDEAFRRDGPGGTPKKTRPHGRYTTGHPTIHGRSRAQDQGCPGTGRDDVASGWWWWWWWWSHAIHGGGGKPAKDEGEGEVDGRCHLLGVVSLVTRGVLVFGIVVL
jgi:hypothetical protein